MSLDDEMNHKKCVWCGSVKELVQHHVSYKPEIIITLCRHCHASRHFNYGKCRLCKQKGLHRLYFAFVDPETGLSYWDTVTHPTTGNLNHPWPRKGRWVLVCDNCREKAVGLSATKRINKGLVKWAQSKWNIDLERAKEKWRAIKGKKSATRPDAEGFRHKELR